MFIFLRKDKKGVGRIFLPTPESIDPSKARYQLPIKFENPIILNLGIIGFF